VGPVNLKWRNIPVPEAFVVGLVAGGILQLLFPARVVPAAWIGHLVGWPLVLLGCALALWAVLEARQMDLSSPDGLLTGGPYAWTRNPMYVGWTLIYLGIAFAANVLWILLLLPPIAAYIHFIDVKGEEAALEKAFGERYRAYQERVPRYF
jgi:protein-S-isoprenylcysteine O-methyltransferase Ste14